MSDSQRPPDDAIQPSDPWHSLRRFTNARIGLPRSGDSVATAAQLQFQLDHAQARDAVHAPLDVARLAEELGALGMPILRLRSAAADRAMYLKRPDLGRRLSDESRRELERWAAAHPAEYDAAFVVADGLSAFAVARHAAALLGHVLPALSGMGWRIAPLVIVEQGRVAIGDEIGAILAAEQVALLVGERPGLSAADSLGVYLTYGPRVGRTDAERNCISNIHGQGLSYASAADTLTYLLSEARRLRLTGVELKDLRSAQDALPPGTSAETGGPPAGAP